MPPISKPEVRFKEGSGTRLMVNGNVRCHALAKSKIRKWREEFNDYDTPTDELWPECQCEQPAETGQYVCRFHGGLTPRVVNPPRTILDIMPLDMAAKYKAIAETPGYISRKEDINLFQLRRNMLIEELQEEANSEEMWGLISEAVVKLRKGDSVNALEYLERARTIHDNKQDVWNEIYRVEKLLGEMTTVHMKAAKDLQSLATAEEVSALVSTLLNAVISGAENYIVDPINRTKFNSSIVAEVRRIMGLSPAQVIDAEFAD